MIRYVFIAICLTVSAQSSPAAGNVDFQPPCLNGLFEGKTGELKKLEIDLDFTGRVTVGDLNADGSPDFVVSNRDKLAAYDVCGGKLWQVRAQTNWDFSKHVFWNWTSFGYIGDADADGEGEFLHIGSNWRTLYVRKGSDGSIKHEIDLGAATQWMYVLLGNRFGEPDHHTTRIFVTGRPGDNNIQAYDIRSGTPRKEWHYRQKRIQNSYMPPAVANIDGLGGDEIAHSTVAVNENGSQIWRHSFAEFSKVGAAHTLTVKDVDPLKSGLETVFSIYGPKKRRPSLVSLAFSRPDSLNWEAYSPFRERHAHQHTVGDFEKDKIGLETLARNNDGKNHWLVDYQGKLLNNQIRLHPSQLPRNWDSGELVQGIEWDEKPGTEILYTERHVAFRDIPRLVVTSSTRPTHKRTRIFHGGVDTVRTDRDPALSNKPDSTYRSWFGYVDRGPRFNNDGPYEGAAHAIDLIGDGREEILTWGAKKIIIYYNSGNANVKKRWADPDYMSTKKLWCNVYNPR